MTVHAECIVDILSCVALKDRSFLLAMKLCRKLNQLVDWVSVIIWRMCEVHVFKVVVFAVFFSCVNEVFNMLAHQVTVENSIKST